MFRHFIFFICLFSLLVFSSEAIVEKLMNLSSFVPHKLRLASI